MAASCSTSFPAASACAASSSAFAFAVNSSSVVCLAVSSSTSSQAASACTASSSAFTFAVTSSSVVCLAASSSTSFPAASACMASSSVFVFDVISSSVVCLAAYTSQAAACQCHSYSCHNPGSFSISGDMLYSSCQYNRCQMSHSVGRVPLTLHSERFTHSSRPHRPNSGTGPVSPGFPLNPATSSRVRRSKTGGSAPLSPLPLRFSIVTNPSLHVTPPHLVGPRCRSRSAHPYKSMCAVSLSTISASISSLGGASGARGEGGAPPLCWRDSERPLPCWCELLVIEIGRAHV